jgi:hypothetical protein
LAPAFLPVEGAPPGFASGLCPTTRLRTIGEVLKARRNRKAGAACEVQRSEAAITSAINQPIVAFVFNQAGLMGSLSLEGSNIARIER